MERGKDAILVTGATGKQGGAVARELLSHGHRVRALTRHPRGPAALRLLGLGAELVEGDFARPATLAPALDGAWGVFSVQNSWEAGPAREVEQGRRLAEVAFSRGVACFVYSSVGSAHRATGIPHFESKWQIEQTVRALSFPLHTILRPVFFMENFLSPAFRPALLEGRLMLALKPGTVLQMVAVADIGKFARLAFEQHVLLNRREIDLAGDERTMPETAEILGRVLGRPIRFVQAPIEDVRRQSEDYAVMLEWFDHVGYNVDIARLEEDYGVRLLRLPGWAAQANWLEPAAA
jgi:uncharacterized protein YbjT (DUF2867 family)